MPPTPSQHYPARGTTQESRGLPRAAPPPQGARAPFCSAALGVSPYVSPPRPAGGAGARPSSAAGRGGCTRVENSSRRQMRALLHLPQRQPGRCGSPPAWHGEAGSTPEVAACGGERKSPMQPRVHFSAGPRGSGPRPPLPCSPPEVAASPPAPVGGRRRTVKYVPLIRRLITGGLFIACLLSSGCGIWTGGFTARGGGGVVSPWGVRGTAGEGGRPRSAAFCLRGSGGCGIAALIGEAERAPPPPPQSGCLVSSGCCTEPDAGSSPGSWGALLLLFQALPRALVGPSLPQFPPQRPEQLGARWGGGGN